MGGRPAAAFRAHWEDRKKLFSKLRDAKEHSYRYIVTYLLIVCTNPESLFRR